MNESVNNTSVTLRTEPTSPVRRSCLREEPIYASAGTSAKGSVLFCALGWLAAAAVCALAWLYIAAMMRFDVTLVAYVGTERLGALESVAVLERARAELEANVSEITGEEYVYPNELRYALAPTVGDVETLGPEECYRLLNLGVDGGIAEAYVLYVDGIAVAANAYRDEIDEAMELVTAEYLAEEAKRDLPETVSAAEITGIELVNSIEVTEEKCSRSLIKTPEEICGLLLAGSGAQARCMDLDLEYGVTRQTPAPTLMAAALFAAPVENAPTALPELQFRLKKTESYTEVVRYETVYEDTNDYYIGMEYLKNEGSEGVLEIVYEVVYEDGRELSRERVSSEIVIESRPRVFIRGSKVPPPAEPTGTYIWPFIGIDISITSYYGEVREQFDGDAYHFGIDVEAPMDTPIYASDGGTVVYSASSSSYGNMVMIEHKNGYRTLYAHMSKLLVKLDDKVYQGQLIGRVGMTGVTTAPHLHFEVRKEYVTLDPIKYLPKLPK